MSPRKSKNKPYEIDFKLSDGDRGALVAIAGQDGFKVIHRLAEGICHDLLQEVINADTEEKIVRTQALAKAASVFWTTFIGRINREIYLFDHLSNAGTIAEDPSVEDLINA